MFQDQLEYASKIILNKVVEGLKGLKLLEHSINCLNTVPKFVRYLWVRKQKTQFILLK